MRRIIPILGHLKDELVVVARLAQPFQRVIGDVTVGRAHQKGGQLAQIVRHPRNFHLFARAIGRFNAQHIPHVHPFQPKGFVQRRTLNQNGLLGRWPRPAHRLHFVQLNVIEVRHGEQLHVVPFAALRGLETDNDHTPPLGRAHLGHTANLLHHFIIKRGQQNHNRIGRADGLISGRQILIHNPLRPQHHANGRHAHSNRQHHQQGACLVNP